MFTLCINTNADKDQLQYQSSSSLSTVSKNSHNHWIISTQQRLYQSSSLLSLIVPVQVATTAVAMNTDHPEWILPITVDYLFESPQGKKSSNSFIFLSWSLWTSSSSFLSWSLWTSSSSFLSWSLWSSSSSFLSWSLWSSSSSFLSWSLWSSSSFLSSILRYRHHYHHH